MRLKYIALLLFTTFAHAQTEQQYYINHCIDGKTCVSIVGPDDEQVELSLVYIDPPDLAQNYGSYARVVLETLLQGKTVSFYTEYANDVTGRQFGRMVLEGNDVAIHMLEQGAAYPHHDTMPPSLILTYTEARDRAVIAEAGVWTRANAPQLLPEHYRLIADPAGQGRVACPVGIEMETECEAFPTFEQAQFAVMCGNQHIDPDGDGVACE